MRRSIAASLLLLPIGCGSGQIGTPGGGDGPVADQSAPLLSIASPERGTLSGDASLTVIGQASDAESGLASVTVNGQPATVDSAGQFSASLPLAPGLVIIETIAVDKAGNAQRDVRAVLAGPLAPVESTVTDAVAGRIGPSGFTVVSGMLTQLVNEIDLGEVARSRNPLVDEGGSCLGVKVNAQSVSKTGVLIQLTPGAGGLGTHAEILGADVVLKANYDVACIGGSATVRIRASKVRIDGNLGVALAGDKLDASVSGLSVALDGFDLDVGGIPGVIVDLFEGTVENKVADALKDAIGGAVPGMTEDLLTELTGQEFQLGVLGQSVGVRITPTALAIDGNGLYVALDTTMTVSGGAGVDYVSSPRPATQAIMTGAESLGIAVADDLLNQLFAGMWGARALEPAIDLEPGHPAQIFFGPDADRIELSFSLPPTVSADGAGELKLMLGDLIVRVIDSDGGAGTLVEMAVSASVGLSATIGADGRLVISVGTPELWAQVLEKSDALPVLFGDEQAKALAELMFTQIGTLADEALGSLPIPAIGDAALTEANMASMDGFLLIRASLGL